MLKNKNIILIVVLSVILIMTAIFTLSKKTDVRVGVLHGPTGISMAHLMDQNSQNKSANQYDFTLADSPVELVEKISAGDIDLATLPTNVAAQLYNEQQNLKVIAVNTLGNLFIIENGNQISSIEDLRGKTLYVSGSGSIPEYVIKFLLQQHSLSTQDINIQYKNGYEELVSMMKSGEISLGLLPEPYVSSVLANNADFRIALDLQEEWNKVCETEMAIGCVVARDDFIKDNEKAIEKFINEYAESINFANEHEEIKNLLEKFNIIPSSSVLSTTIDNCNIAFVNGNEMVSSLKDFFNVLFQLEPKSIGETLPDDNFYYVNEK